jgi:hypothetical protein
MIHRQQQIFLMLSNLFTCLEQREALQLQEAYAWCMKTEKQNRMTWGSHSNEYEDGCLLGCSAV